MSALLSVNDVQSQGLIPSHDEIALSLYRDVVLPAEKAASEAGNSNNAMFARIVGYLLLYPPSEDARQTLKSEIGLCKHEINQNQNHAVYELGDMYFQNFIRLFFRTIPSEASTPESEQLEGSPKSPDCYALLMAYVPGRSNTTPTAPDHSHAEAAALARDNFSCLLSGKPDMRSYWKRFITEVPPGRRFARTNCCYIFPDSLQAGDPGTNRANTLTEHQIATFWTILERFGYEQVRNELDGVNSEGSNLRRMENVMTLECMIHQGFDRMFLWLEEIPGERNTYHIRLAGPMSHREWDIPQETVTFTAHTGDPLPSPTYLRIHAACCHVANMSGAAEYLNAIADEVSMEDADSSLE